MPVNVTKVQQKVRPFSKFAFQKLLAVIENVSLDIVLEAKAHHRFEPRSGNLEKSIRNVISVDQGKITSTFDLNDRIANYGNRIHRGFKTWKPDPFLENAFNSKIKSLKKLIKEKIKEMK